MYYVSLSVSLKMFQSVRHSWVCCGSSVKSNSTPNLYLLTLAVNEKLPVVLWPLRSCADWAAHRWVQNVWCSGINNERKAIASLWLLCGSAEALRGWKRLMKSTRESGGVPTAQRCNLNRSACTCFQAPLSSSSSGCSSFNDLQISLIFPENIVATVLSRSLGFHVVRLPTDELQKQQRITTVAAQAEWFVSAALVSMWSDTRAPVFSWWCSITHTIRTIQDH